MSTLWREVFAKIAIDVLINVPYRYAHILIQQNLVINETLVSENYTFQVSQSFIMTTTKENANKSLLYFNHRKILLR